MATKSKKSKKVKFSYIVNTFTGVVVFSLIMLILFNYVKVNELSSEVRKYENQLEEVESEMQQLGVELERKIDLRNIEKVAKEELGMSKIEKTQKEYVSLGEKDKIEVIKKTEDKSVSSNALSGIMTSLSIIGEYLK